MLYNSGEQLNHLVLDAKKSATQSNIRVTWCVTCYVTNTDEIARIVNGGRLLSARVN